jgi:hypothetical protein
MKSSKKNERKVEWSYEKIEIWGKDGFTGERERQDVVVVCFKDSGMRG